MIKAIIFDFDGLIIDTETPAYLATKDIYAQHGFDLSLSEYSQCIGTSLDVYNPYAILSERTGIPMDAIRDQVKEVFRERMEEAGLRPGVMDYIQTAKRLGLKVGLASSSTYSWIETYSSKFRLLEAFDVIRTADHVRNVKPDPELYLQALDALQVEGDEALAFEDSVNGWKAATAAGAHCVVVPNEVTCQLEFDPEVFKLQSMAEMPLTEILSMISRGS